MADVLVLVGSESDKPRIEPAFEILSKAGVSYEFHVSSAHRQPEQTTDLVKTARKKGFKVVIAGAGLSAALPGFAASLTDLPVIGVPFAVGPLNGLDALLATAQVPGGVPASPSAPWGSTTPRTPPTWRCGSSRPDMRVGIGYDSHRFADRRKLILGGVTVPHLQGLAGHSDADVVAHALTDAVLGAAGLGDIGAMFPPTDPQWRDANSLELLKQAYLRVVEAGLNFVSADITVILERPRLAPFIDAMREKLAAALVTGTSTVSVKAKTNEGMGWIGRGEGVAVIAVALLDRRS